MNFYQRRRKMEGEEVHTTYREMLGLHLLGLFCEATQTDWDTAINELDKEVILTHDILKGMGLA
jgi:hypothetical protein